MGALRRRRARTIADEDVDREVEERVENWRIRGLVIDMHGRIMVYTSNYTSYCLYNDLNRVLYRGQASKT